jgi:tetratricopeptide (TPR) repeat protein
MAGRLPHLQEAKLMTHRTWPGVLIMVIVAGLGSLPACAQEKWTWPEKPKDLQVLPKDWPGSRLEPVMKGFTRALGVRCSHCHKGEEGKPLSTYDFASNENPNKDRAREMLRMLGDINDDLKKIQPSGDQRVNMWCHTCHHGLPRPMTLEEELGEQYRKKGVQAAIEDYAALRVKFYGRNAYDFGEGSLGNFGGELLGKNDVAGAIRIFKLNTEQFPQSARVWDGLGEAYMKAGDPKSAQESYQKALGIDPADEKAKEMLKKISETKKEEKN